MSDEEMRVAIAEATGQWKDCRIIPGGPHDFDVPFGKPLMVDGTFSLEEEVVDNYLTDLNAMQEAEKVLEFDTYLRFVVNLCNVCGWRINHADDTIYVGNMYRMLQATARQRAIAFLKTLNLYKA